LINELIAAGADIRAKDALDCAVIHHAVFYGSATSFGLLPLLVAHGADPNTFDRS
jgi:ankyrin repeat protein